MNNRLRYNQSFFWSGILFFIISVTLVTVLPFYTEEVLGINALIKPLKFSISIWIYLWSMALLLPYVENKDLVRKFTWLSIFTMLFEQTVITVQALRGTLSHFNQSNIIEGILFGLMGIFITAITIYTVVLAFSFKKQVDEIDKSLKIAIFWGLLIFVFGSFIGGAMGAINSHNVGGEMGGEGLEFINWSMHYGDLRISHFIGIHALQIIPFFGFIISKIIRHHSHRLIAINMFSLIYFLLVAFLLAQALLAIPITSLWS